jgi:hypothetical protein
MKRACHIWTTPGQVTAISANKQSRRAHIASDFGAGAVGWSALSTLGMDRPFGVAGHLREIFKTNAEYHERPPAIRGAVTRE